MKKLIVRALLPLFFVPLVACGQQGNNVQTDKKTVQATVVALSESKQNTIKKAFEAKFEKQVPGGIKVVSVSATPLSGIYEVVLPGKQIVYSDENADYVFAESNLIDVKQGKNLTEEKLAQLNIVDFSSLPLEQAIKEVKGNGTLKIAVFSDPDCPYCKKLEEEFAKLDDITVYTFLMPITSLHPQADVKAKKIWCSQDKTGAWTSWMRNGVEPTASEKCDNPVEQIMALGNELGFTGTPTLIFPNGTVIPGYLPATELMKVLQENQK
ncbi:DsbC family protein [Neisseria sp. Ec49-e6-T10]|uniref:DsbC family protein n=1 Tax=Neisseria sp. Ec49-e6-T10 TaxID=3140744 RepID=UPI003EC0E4C6